MRIGDTKEVVRGTLTFVGVDGSTEYSVQVEAMVSWNMPGLLDFILSLPLVVTYSLLSSFGGYRR